MPITLAVAWASYRWFEPPFLALKRRFRHIRSGPDEAADTGCPESESAAPSARVPSFAGIKGN